MNRYKAIGLMSGTSLDGIDIAACEFTFDDGKWSFEIVSCQTYPYSPDWVGKLAGLHTSDALTFSLVNIEYGCLLGRLARTFMDQTGFHPDLIASHGHTIFHQPSRSLTVQVGAGGAIAAEARVPVVCDFRTMDVALGGQGAPLVPIGDRYLFSAYDACLNLGGFANISFEHEGLRIAFDICPVNIVLNKLAARLDKEYDEDGEIARSGVIIPELLQMLNQIPYYGLNHPKSLGREWLEKEFLPIIEHGQWKANHLLRTVCEHIAQQVTKSLPPGNSLRILATGGGAHNRFLVERIGNIGNYKVIIPLSEWVDYKEALIFAFLGVLRWIGESNVLHSVTGSRIDHSGGVIYQPF
jgi:anhydro-N-acetylmuramic acid kinase